jgi:hypothetical protein
MNENSQSRATLLLFLLFFLGLSVALFALIDLNWTHRVLVKDSAPAHATRERR